MEKLKLAFSKLPDDTELLLCNDGSGEIYFEDSDGTRTPYLWFDNWEEFEAALDTIINQEVS